MVSRFAAGIWRFERLGLWLQASPRRVGEGIAYPQMQMGPTRRSTPLSPARGPFRRKVLGAQCRCRLAPIRRTVSSGSVTGARTGIRFRRAVGRDPKILSVHPAVPRPNFPGGPSPLACIVRPKPFDANRWQSAGRAQPMAALLRVPAGCLASNRSSQLGVLKDRADRCRHLDPD